MPVVPPPPQTRSGRDYKRCQIRRDEDGHLWLSGVARRFCSLRELLGTSGRRGLQAQGAEMHLEATCPSHPKGDTRGCPRERVVTSQSGYDIMEGLCDVTELAVTSQGSYMTS